LNYDCKGMSHKIFLKIGVFELFCLFLRDCKGNVFENIGIGDDYTDVKVLPLIIICYYRGRSIKKIFFLLYGNFNIKKPMCGDKINVGINKWSSVA